MENWSNDNVSPSFSKMNLEQQAWDEVGPNIFKDEVIYLRSPPSQQCNPLNLSQHIYRVATLYVPSMRNPRVQEKETINLQEILLALITCTLPLIALMKVKIELWKGLTKKLVEQRVLNKDHLNVVLPTKTIVGGPVELSKVSRIQGKDEESTTLPINYE